MLTLTTTACMAPPLAVGYGASGYPSTVRSEGAGGSAGLTRPPLLADRSYQLGLAHLGAAVDAQPRGLAPQLRDRHGASTGAGPLRRAALARCRLGSLATERRAGPPWQLGDRPLPARPGLRLLHVPPRGLTLLLCGHLSSRARGSNCLYPGSFAARIREARLPPLQPLARGDQSGAGLVHLPLGRTQLALCSFEVALALADLGLRSADGLARLREAAILAGPLLRPAGLPARRCDSKPDRAYGFDHPTCGDELPGLLVESGRVQCLPDVLEHARGRLSTRLTESARGLVHQVGHGLPLFAGRIAKRPRPRLPERGARGHQPLDAVRIPSADLVHRPPGHARLPESLDGVGLFSPASRAQLLRARVA